MRTVKWIAALLLALSLAPVARAGGGAPKGMEDRLIVAVRPGVALADAQKAFEARGYKVLNGIPSFRMLLIQAEPGKSGPALASLKAMPVVLAAARDFWTKWIESSPASMQETPLPTVESVRAQLPRIAPRRGLSPAPDAGSGQGSEVQWGVKRVNAPAAWAAGNQGAGIKVAVVDTGIDPEHPDLKGKVDGGYNAVEEGKPWVDDHFHGTHVAGIIAATLNGDGVVGVAPLARLYSVKVLTKEGSGSLFGILFGLSWCSENGMQVVNMSLGSPQGNEIFEMGVQMVYNAGVAIIAAAGNGDGNGNSSPVNFPGAYKETIAVSALDEQDLITKWSSRGPEVGFIAPGSKIPSTVPLWHDPSGVKAYSGTSMATPHVTGLAALAVSKGAQGPEGVRAALRRAATKLPNLSDGEQGAGVIDAGKL